MENEKLLTVGEMAEKLRVSKQWLYMRTMKGANGVPHLKVGRYLRFKESEVMTFLSNQQSITV